ncbi:hypothetical protein DE146DRAFT_661354 [Phaeosphaeria sp. MPI-PUGE-AT-0046c]|nr:hypothetical protein DE146DRAFT_661354 [Phaeosphaeria sp. MPI-PUGE-AT-0046c]
MFVDPNRFFECHRFCEEGVSEPSYQNDRIFLYPFEYYTGGTLNIDGKASGDCQAILDRWTRPSRDLLGRWSPRLWHLPAGKPLRNEWSRYVEQLPEYSQNRGLLKLRFLASN